MKLYTFELGQQRRLGAEWQAQLVDLAVAYEAAAAMQPPQPNRLRVFPGDMLTFLRIGAPAIEAAAEAMAFVKKRRAAPVGEQILYPIDAVKLRAPVLRPGKIICCEVNGNSNGADDPSFYLKVASAIIGPGESILKLSDVGELTFNPHLAVLMRARLKNRSEDEVLSSIFGYTLLNDFTATKAAGKELPPLIAKNFDAFCPLGPCLVTTNELSITPTIQIHTTVNGSEKSLDACTFPVARTLSFLSRIMTLEPGDIVSFGLKRGQGFTVKAGDVIAIEVEGLGRLENQIIGG
ncbi:MAG TPA: fumarylacetoacetate hydrolase family protein [Verrucomicrobiae bacterium]